MLRAVEQAVLASTCDVLAGGLKSNGVVDLRDRMIPDQV